MAAIDNLKTAIANLGSQVSSDLGDLNTSLQTELTAIASALSNNPSEADVQAQADAVTALAGTTMLVSRLYRHLLMLRRLS